MEWNPPGDHELVSADGRVSLHRGRLPTRLHAAPPELDQHDLARELESKVPGAASHYDPDHPGMHTTQTVDFGVVLDGHVVLELDDGEVSLGPGDVIVQNGARHAWRNRSDRICTMAFVLIGADVKR
jgi:mannose-6-phosphate isomerase-like protein (cupin superfamily)